MVVKNYDLPKRTYACELDFDLMAELQQDAIKFVEMPKYPGSSRDIALVLDEDVPASKLRRPSKPMIQVLWKMLSSLMFTRVNRSKRAKKPGLFNFIPSSRKNINRR